MKVSFEKWQGCGNDYVFVDFVFSSQERPSGFPKPEWIQSISKRSSALGSDGLILILPPENPEKAVARMQMFNADASEAQMCGNGIRCLAALLHEKKPELKSFGVETKAGLRHCEILSGEDGNYEVKINMGRPTFIPANIPVLFDDVMVVNEEFELGGREFLVSCVSMGNPHCVVDVKDLENFPVEEFGPMFEKHEVFPEGVNVEFIEQKGFDVYQRTWERGSGETQACGTGACAVGVTLVMRNKIDSPMTIHLKGGDLQVAWDGLREVFLQGNAVREFSGDLEWEDAAAQDFKLEKK